MLRALVACADVWGTLATAKKGDGKGHALSQSFVHLEHVDPFDTEDGLHFVVADDVPSVFRGLEILRLDVFPYLLNGLWTRQLVHTKQCGQRFTRT